MMSELQEFLKWLKDYQNDYEMQSESLSQLERCLEKFFEAKANKERVNRFEKMHLLIPGSKSKTYCGRPMRDVAHVMGWVQFQQHFGKVVKNEPPDEYCPICWANF